MAPTLPAGVWRHRGHLVAQALAGGLAGQGDSGPLGSSALAVQHPVAHVAKWLLRRSLRLAILVFAPDAFLRQLLAIVLVISLRRTLLSSHKFLRAAFLAVACRWSEKERHIRHLQEKRRKCQDYPTFKHIGEQLDVAMGLDRWKRDDKSPHFDAKRLRERTKKYKEFMESGDVEGCLFALRQELLRKHFGVCNPRLFEVSNTGTKAVVERYVDTVCETMTWAAFEHREHREHVPGGVGDFCASLQQQRRVTLSEKLAFFSETKHSFGRCALLLSGGAQLGMYHFGVVKALHLNGFLPRILSGTSAGAIVCGIICVRDDAELTEMWTEDFEWEKAFNLRFFGDYDFSRFIQRGGEALYNSDCLETALKENVGECTFLEAYDRTGRICNITVSGLPGNTEYPMLLNYLTSPHVLIWSAALASASVPGIFEPRELLAKDREGRVVPYYHGGLKWRDGSMQNDLPMTRLTELFNVNFFIVSQVNPHAMMMSGGSLAEGELGCPRGPLYHVAHFLRRELKEYLLSLASLGLGTAGQRVSPWLRPVGYSVVGLIVQEYEGDITIYNGRGIQEMPYLLRNGTEEMLRRYTADSELRTWWAIPQIENSCKIEFVMDEILRELRAEAGKGKGAGELQGGGNGLSSPYGTQLIKRMISSELGITRLPSFHKDIAQLAMEQGLQKMDRFRAHGQHDSGPDGSPLRPRGLGLAKKRSGHLLASSHSLNNLMVLNEQ